MQLYSLDFNEIKYQVSKSLYNRLKGVTKRFKGRFKKLKIPESEIPRSNTYKKLYGRYKSKPKVIAGITIFPIYGSTHEYPTQHNPKINSYTKEGREFIHDKLSDNTKTNIMYLLRTKIFDETVELHDNSISLMSSQKGKCGVTGEPLIIHGMECHHKLPKAKGGTDEYKNLIWVTADVHKLIHATREETVKKYLTLTQLDKKTLKKVNSLRLLAENFEINEAV